MCNGIALIVLKEDDGSIKVIGKPSNGSHDDLLHEFVPVEEHDNTIKIEYLYPNTIKLDCPDETCREQAVELGLVEKDFLGVLQPTRIVLDKIYEYLKTNPDVAKFDLKQLMFAQLSGADLSGTNLYGADFSGTNLSRADFSGANLYGANLSGADLSGTNLYGANLSRADFSGANLYGANLKGHDLEDLKKRGAIVE